MGFTPRCGLEIQPGPWRTDNVDAQFFVLAANSGALQALCDRYLNVHGTPGTRFEPVAPVVALSFQNIHDLRSTSPHATQDIGHTYQEAAWWVMVQDRNKPADPVRLMVPFIFLNNTVALATGREIYGYPKEFADVQIPPPGGIFSVTGLANQSMGAGIVANPSTLMFEAKPLLSGLSAGIGISGLGPNILVALSDPAEFDRFSFALEVAAVVKLLLGGQLDFIFLRQFTDFSSGTPAYRQHLVAAPCQIRRNSFHLQLTPYQVAIPALATHPFVNQLGLVTLPIGTAHQSVAIPLLAMSIGMAFELGLPAPL